MTAVIAAIDGSQLAKAVQDGAIWAANLLQAPIKFVHALEKELSSQPENYSGAIGLGAREQLHQELTQLDNHQSKVAYETGQDLLKEAQAYAAQHNINETSIEQRHGELIETLCYFASQAQLIVLGHKGESHGEDAQHIGAHLENGLRTLTCPLLVTVAPFHAPKSFMIAYDGGETAEQLLQFVINQPLLKTLDAHIVMVNDKHAKDDKALMQAKTLLNSKGFSTQTAVIKNDYGSIADTLLAYQHLHDIDMIAMGAFTKKGLRRFFVGTNTTKVISKTSVPVLVMK